MDITKDVHEQFASFFPDKGLRRWAYILSRKMGDGHICVPVDDDSLFADAPPIYPSEGDTSYLENCPEYVSTDPATVRPFILHQNKFYFHRYFNYETRLIGAIQHLLQNEKKFSQERQMQLAQCMNKWKDVLSSGKVPDGLPDHEKPDWQLLAAIQAFLQGFSIITGGPGTGKTTTVAKVLVLLYESNPAIRVAMAAPTGKAAARMKESLRGTSLNVSMDIKEWFSTLDSMTIHRLLGSKPDSIYFKHNSAQPLPYDVIIVDEASMIDMPLFSKLMDAVKPESRLILLGDRNQLASVEAGSILGDLCKCTGGINRFSNDAIQLANEFIEEDDAKIPESGSTPADSHPLSGHIVELFRNYRFAKNPEIGLVSRQIIQNEKDGLEKSITESAFEKVKFDTEFSGETFDAYIDAYQDYIKEADIAEALKKLNQLRVLVVTREGENGLLKVNKRIETYLSRKRWIQTDSEFYENRPIIVTKNNNDLKIYNGDIGIVRKKDGEARVWFPDGENKVRYLTPAQITDSETVFAMTIHKSQGSEYDNVLVLLPDTSEHPLLTRELLYTGMTRAKNSVLIQGRKETILYAAQAEVKRSSGIGDRVDSK